MKINTTMVYGIGGLLLGYWLAKRAANAQPTSASTSNTITSTGEWWTYAGMWK